MKKISLLIAAASALMLTACTSEEDILQDVTQQTASKAVGFDVYLPQVTNVTRAGLEGTMTTGRLQRSEYEGGGFGVYAFQTKDDKSDSGDAVDEATPYSATAVPNFMINEKILWNDKNQGWYYNPLKYWPNETDNDSQTPAAEMIGSASTSHLDRLTFFAYAPYVKTAADAEGITFLTNKKGYLDTDPTSTSTSGTATTEPTIGYQAAIDDPNKAVDLLWGVAPAGGLTYTAVNGHTVNVAEGLPLINMTKPDVNTNMKFLFQHALARIGVTAVAAVDQMGAGGTLDHNTKITINKITLTGYFGKTGNLDLNNTTSGAGVARWIKVNDIDLSGCTFESTTPPAPPAATDLKKTTLTLKADQSDPDNVGTIATHLQFVGTATDPDAASATPVAQDKRIGVTTVRQNVIQPALINNALTPTPGNRNWYTVKEYAKKELKYSETTPYYTDKNCSTKATATVYDINGDATSTSNFVYTVNDKGVYTKTNAAVTLTYPDVNKYLAMSFTKVTASGSGGDYAADNAVVKGKQAYSLDVDGLTYKPKPVGEAPVENDYVITYNTTTKEDIITKANAAYTWDGDLAKKEFYKRDANYFMVIPTNNFVKENGGLSSNEEKLRTVRVMIEYYITTTDSKVAGGLVQTKNVIEKDVVFPSIANGKSYNLNLVLGLTSVKMEAEVDDWKVINVQGDLPQNTAE